jgi:hypothetical protein
LEQRTVLGVGHEEIKRRDHRVLNRIDLPLEWPPQMQLKLGFSVSWRGDGWANAAQSAFGR